MNPYRDKEEIKNFVPKNHKIILTHNNKNFVLHICQKLNDETIKGIFIEDLEGFSIAVPDYLAERAIFIIDGARVKGRVTSPKRYL